MRASRANSARAGVTLWGVLLVAFLAAGCARGPTRELDDGRILHRKLDYSIEAPQFGDDTSWHRIGLDGADLAWYSDDGRSMSLASSCKKTRAEPYFLARRLLTGVPRDDVLSAYPILHRGDPGWAQTVVTGTGREAVRVKTVTVVNGGCIFDWVLVTPAQADHEASAGIFDAWWPSFRRPAAGGDAEPAEPTGGRDAEPADPGAAGQRDAARTSP